MVKLIRVGYRKEVKSGTRFGRLIVVRCELRDTGQGNRTWAICVCDCDKRKRHAIRLNSLLQGKTKSCGCLMNVGRTPSNYKHGMSDSPLYAVWRAMRSRCELPSNNRWKWYGAQGIEVCDDWKDFTKFLKWARKSGYRLGLSIDRINPYRGYTPENCRWITVAENTRRARLDPKQPVQHCDGCGKSWRDAEIDHCFDHCHADFDRNNERQVNRHHYGKCC